MSSNYKVDLQLIGTENYKFELNSAEGGPVVFNGIHYSIKTHNPKDKERIALFLQQISDDTHFSGEDLEAAIREIPEVLDVEVNLQKAYEVGISTLGGEESLELGQWRENEIENESRSIQQKNVESWLLPFLPEVGEVWQNQNVSKRMRTLSVPGAMIIVINEESIHWIKKYGEMQKWPNSMEIIGKEMAFLALGLIDEKIQLNENLRSRFLVTKTPDLETYFSYYYSTEAFNCSIVINTRGQGTVILSHSPNGEMFAKEVIPAVAKAYHWPDQRGQPFLKETFLSSEELEAIGQSIPIDLETWRAFVGQYLYEEHLLTLSMKNGKLFLKVDEKPSYLVTPIGSTMAYYKGEELFWVYPETPEMPAIIKLFGLDHIKLVEYDS